MNERDKKKVFIILVLLVVAVSLAFSTSCFNAFDSPKRFFLRSFSVILLGYWIFANLRGSRKHFLNSKTESQSGDCPCNLIGQPSAKFKIPFIIVGLYSLVVVLSLIFSSSPVIGIDRVVDLLAEIVVFFVIVASFEISDIKKMIPYLIFTGGIVSLYSLAQHAGLDMTSWAEDHATLVRTRSISTLGNPDFLSAFLVMIIPVVFNQAFREESRRFGWFYLFIWGFLSLINLLTFSRAGLLGFIAGTSVTVILIGKKVFLEQKQKTAAIAILFCASICLLILLNFLGVVKTSAIERIVQGFDTTNANVSSRIYLWKTGIMITQAHPLLGAGPGSFNNAYLPYRYLEPLVLRQGLKVPGSTHNIFIDLACSSGIIALILFVLFLCLAVGRGVMLLKKRDEMFSDSVIVLPGFYGGLAGFIACHLAGFPTIPVDLLFWVFAGFCFIEMGNKTNQSTDNGTQETRRPGAIQWAILILTAMVILFVINSSWLALYADYFFKRAKEYQAGLYQTNDTTVKEKIFANGLGFFDKTLKLSPRNPEYWLSRGKFIEAFSYTNVKKELNKQIVQDGFVSYQMAINLNPGNPYPYADLGRLLARWGFSDKAEEFYLKAIALDPYNFRLVTDTAAVLESNKKYAEAEEKFKIALKILPDNTITYGNLGLFYLKREKFDEAEKYLKMADSFSPLNQISAIGGATGCLKLALSEEQKELVDKIYYGLDAIKKRKMIKNE